MVTYQTAYDDTMNTFAHYLKSLYGVDDFNFSINDDDDFDYTVRFTYNRHFDIVIHYISGCSVYFVSVKLSVSDDYTINKLPLTNALGIFGVLTFIKNTCDITEF